MRKLTEKPAFLKKAGFSHIRPNTNRNEHESCDMARNAEFWHDTHAITLLPAPLRITLE